MSRFVIGIGMVSGIRYNNNRPLGGMVYTTDLKSVTVRFMGSSPIVGITK